MKTIIFDWGGIILRERYRGKDLINLDYYCDVDAIVDTISSFNNNLSRDEAYDIYKKTLRDENNEIISVKKELSDKYKWFERIRDKGNLECDYESFIETFINNYKKIDRYESVVKFIESLKDKVNLCLFSDLIFVCYESLCNHINLNIFDYIFLSYEEGFIKSDINAFINVEKKLNVEKEEILFIDNSLINIERAKERGWNTCLSCGEDLDYIKECVEKFLN